MPLFPPLSLADDIARTRASRPATWCVPAAMLVLAWWLAARHLDQRWAQLLFSWEGGAWSLKPSFLLEHVLHRGGRWLSLLAWLGLLTFTAWRWPRAADRHWTRPAAWLLVALLASTLLVTWAKSITHMDCPWDLAGLGGERPFVSLFAMRPEALGRPACFPAAHAASGYAWVALYFFFAKVRPRWRRAGLLVGLLAGAVFGLAQQLRGAHFLSHDLASLLLCWTVACGVARIPDALTSATHRQARA